MAYVNIHIDNTPLGTTTDQKGQFVLNGLSDSSYGVTFSMIGFQSVTVETRSTESDPLFISLQPEIYLSREVVVSASRKAQSLSLAPASVGIITRDYLKSSGTSSFDDAFHQINGIQVTRSSGSNVQSLSIRGASEVAGGGIGNRVLLLLDGRPAITPESGGALWNLVPLGAIERIEVIKGAYSSLFGSSAMGGIVNIITNNADTTPRTELELHYGAYGKAPSYAEFTGYHDYYGIDVTHSLKKNKWSFVFNAALRDNDGHREKTAFTTWNGFAKIKYDFSPNRSLQISGMYNDIFNDTPATWLNITHPYSVAEHRKDDTQHRREWNADMHYQAFARANIKYSTRFYYYAGISDFVFNGDPENDSTNVNKGKQFIDTERVFVDRIGNNTQIDISMGDDHYVLGGVELQTDYIDGRPDTVLYGIHRAFNIGAFVQDQWTPDDRWTITGGIRWDHYNITGTFMESNISPKIAAVFKATERISVRTLIARAFRNPSIAERYTKFEQGGGLSFRPNPNLRAEKLTLSAEVGTKITVTPKLRFDAAVFYNHYKDLISYQQRSVPGEELLFEVINLNKAIMQGFEISGDFMATANLSFHGGYTYLDARDASDERFNDVLSYKSKHTFYLTGNATVEKFGFSLQARGRSRIDEVFIYPGSEPDGYILFNAKAGYTFNTRFHAALHVENISDVQYEEIERYRMEGRHFTLRLNWTL